MRRLAPTIVLVAAALAPAPAGATAQTCSDITHHGYMATGVREQNMGCAAAHGLARHIIDHGPSGLTHYVCHRSYLPKDVTLWTCTRLLQGELLKAEFGVRRVTAATLAPSGETAGCADLTTHGYHATGFRVQGVQCSFAHTIARNVIAHGVPLERHWGCVRSFLPKNVTLWNCARDTQRVEFGVRPISRGL